MSSDYLSRSKSHHDSFNYTNNSIFKEIKSLVRQEKYILETENDELKKNNEELSNRIQDLYDEFDTTSRMNHAKHQVYMETVNNAKHLHKKTKSTQRKNSTLLKDKHDHQKTLNDMKRQLILSEDSLSMIKLKGRESDAEYDLKSKEVELLETQNLLLQYKIKEMENYNKDLQKEFKAVTKTMKNAQEKPDNYSGLLLKPEVKSLETGIPTYIDIFDNKEKVDTYVNNKRHKYEDTKIDHFLISDKKNDNGHIKPIIIYDPPTSPIYADINSTRKQNLASTLPILQHSLEYDVDKKKLTFFPEEQSLSLNVEKEFVKLSQEHHLLNEKLELFDTNYKSCIQNNEETEALLKKTSDEVAKMSAEQQQIVNLLMKNSTILDQLQEKKQATIQKKSISKSEKNESYDTMPKQLKYISCQTDAVFEAGVNQPSAEGKMSQNENMADLCKLMYDQNEIIRNISDKLVLIHPGGNPSGYVDSTKLFQNVTNKSQNSFDDISNLSDILQPNLNLAVATSFTKVDETKSLSSPFLSTSDSKYSLSADLHPNVIGQCTDSFDNIENLPLEIPLENVYSAEIIVPKLSVNVANQPRSNNIKKYHSKIPKLMTSKSLDFSDNKMNNDSMKTFSNDLESSYETLYDPVSSARYEKENTILL